MKFGAGEGNRTLVISLEGWSFTTKLHPHNLEQVHSLNSFSRSTAQSMVEGVGFEPT